MLYKLLSDEEPIFLTREQVAYVIEVLEIPPTESAAAIRKLLKKSSVLDG